MGRILAVDFGLRRMGLAVSDLLGITAQGIPTLSVGNKAEGVRSVVEACIQWEASEIVVGLPLNMDGTKGEMAQEARRFADRIEAASGLPVTCWDERLTTVSAQRVLQESGMRQDRKKGAADRIAATLLLENYMQSREQQGDQWRE
jgi:putative Holliday junction resolvase